MRFMADVKITLEDLSDEYLKKFDKQAYAALEAVGMQAERHAKEKCPVRTGRLRNSITHTVRGQHAYIGTDVEYAPHVELGTSRQKKKPYLKPAAQNYSEEYKAIFARYFNAIT